MRILRAVSVLLLLLPPSGCIRGHGIRLPGDLSQGAVAADGSRADGPPSEARQGWRTDGRACAYTCDVDLTLGKSSCAAPLTVTAIAPAEKRAALQVDLAGHSRLTVTIELCDPVSWVLHIGDSPSNNGDGGDSGQFSNDAELQLRDAVFTVVGNDHFVDPTKVLLTVPGFVPAKGCATREIRVSDGKVETVEPPHSLSSPYALRLNQADTEGNPDALFYVGLNRVAPTLSDRVGSGMKLASLCID